MATEVYFDPEHGVEVWNGSDIKADDLMQSMRANPMIAALTKWTQDTHGGGTRSKGKQSLFDRDRYVTPTKIFDQFRVAQDAVENDDVVGGWMETTENLAFSNVDFECSDAAQQDVWNQIGEDLDLTERMREMYRGYSTCSQVYPMVWWGRKSYKYRGLSGTGKQSKKSFPDLTVPMALTHLDPLKVAPVGNLMFNRDSLAYIADTSEVDELDAAAIGDPAADPIAQQMIASKYEPDNHERRFLVESGVTPDRLYLMKHRNVFRHTATRMQYQRFAPVRMKPVFELLDMKHQLRQMDRGFLVGGTNFILIVTQGSDQRPAKPAEIAHLNAAVRTIARVPLIVGDHRLEVKIVTPPQDYTLSTEKYATLNTPITAFLYRMFLTSHSKAGSGGDDQVKIAKIVARGLEAVRERQAKAWARHIVKITFEANEALTEPPRIRFSPRRIQLDFDMALAQLLLDIYDRGDASRDTMLSLVDLNQDEEASKVEYEAEQYDHIFQTSVPFTGPGKGAGSDQVDQPGDQPAPAEDPRSAGRRKGGNRRGGGAAPGSGQGQPPADTRQRSKQRRVAATADEPGDGQ